MNILFITQTVVNPFAGGVQRVTYTLAKEFQRMDYRAHFLALKNSGKQGSDIPANQLLLPNMSELTHIDNLRFVESFLVDNRIDFIINQVGIFPEINLFLRRVNRGKAKWINVHHNCVSCLNARYREIVMGNHRNSRLWTMLDRLPVWNLLARLNRIKYGRYLRNAMRFADQLVLLSPSYIPELKSFGVGADRDKVSAIGNPLSMMPPSSILAKQRRIIYVGRLGFTQKRVDKLLRIWHALHEEFPDWEFDVVGDGEARDWMENYVHRHQLSRIFFHGTADPGPFLQQASVLTSTSDFEGYPMVLVEAQAYGVVPVCYASFSAVTELVEEGKTGFIVDDLSIESYIEKMKAVLPTIDSQRLQIMGEAMKRKVLQTTPAFIAGKWIQLFNELHATK